jgi:FimV-like protein
MMLRRGMAALLLACAAAMAVPAQAQVAPGTYEVKKGEGLYAIGGRVRYEGATRFQIIAAIYRANPDVFPDGNINVLREGQILKLPSREEVAAITPAEASRQYQTLIAAPAPAAVPAALPKGLEQAMRRYQEGLALERKGDDQGALTAFLEAGEGGYGLAQRKLGQIYDKGNSAVKRDLQASILWYQKARAQGVPVDKPVQRVLPKWSSN